MDNTQDEKKSKKHIGGMKIYAAVITACFISALSLLIYVLIDNSGDETVIVNGDDVVSADEYILASQVAKLIEDEHDVAYEKAYDECTSQILDTIKEKMSGGDTTLSMLRELFPEYLIYNDTDGYVFCEILDLPKNSFSVGDFWFDDDSGRLRYIGAEEINVYNVIDVSKFQGEIDWEKVKADGIDCAFIRVGLRGYGSGALVEDDYFYRNIEGAKEAGIKVGVYMFSEAISEEEAIEEAQFVLERIEEYDIELPVVLDIEEIAGEDARNEALSQKELTDVCKAFFEAIEDAGYSTMLYGNLKSLIGMVDLEQLDGVDIWYAFYDDDIYIPYEVAGWQYASDGTVDGITGSCDLNIFFKDWD